MAGFGDPSATTSRTPRRRRTTSPASPASWVVGLVVSTLCVTTPARAFHTEEQRITDESAYTLRKNDVRLGLWKVQYGIFDPLMVGTHVWPWLFRISNLHVKGRLWHGPTWTFSAYTGFFHFDTKNLQKVEDDSGRATITAIPFELAASYRANDALTFTLAPVWTTVTVRGQLDDDALSGAGRGAVGNFQLTGTVEWRLSRVTALLFHGRYLVAQTAQARGDLVFQPDEFTTVELHLDSTSQSLDYRRAASLAISGVWSWEVFNLRAGLVFGHYNIPGVNFVLGESRVMPELDLYWIF